MSQRCQRLKLGILPTLLALVFTGCASKESQRTEANSHFIAGQEEAFAMLQRSGIDIVRVVGPFQIPVVRWRPNTTLAQVILEAGYLEQREPKHILIQRGATAIPVNPETLLQGEDVPIEAGDVVHVFP